MKKLALLLIFGLSIFTLASCGETQTCTEHVDANSDGKCDTCGTEVSGEQTQFQFETPVTDSVKLTESYEGKDFIRDGIGTATVASYIDGDTTIFKTSGGTKITVRYQGVDTPESTYTVDPWGFAAAAYTKNILKNAKTIVLQAESMENRVDTTGKRYLAWVWVDGRLLNLELAELGYAEADASGTTYAQEFIQAIIPVMNAKERIYGGRDPNYDYSGTRTTLSIKELREQYGTEESINAQKDKGKRVSISGTITRVFGTGCAYLQQYNSEDGEYYGIYLYGGYSQITKFKVGHSVVVNGTIGYYFGQLQISSITNASITVNSYTNQDSVVEMELQLQDLYKTNYNLMGNLVHINEEIQITGYYDSENSNGFTLETNYKCSDGNYLDIRVDQNINLVDENGKRITSGADLVGRTIISFVGIVSYYDGNYDSQDPQVYDGNIQLMWASYGDVEFK